MVARTAVLIPSRTPELLDLCLRAHALFTPAEVEIVVVNTAPYDTHERAAVSAGARAMRAEVHPGAPDATYSRWCHDAAAEARRGGATLLVFANDDAVVMPNWHRLMLDDIEALRRGGKKPGLLGACSNCISGPQACIGSGGRHANGTLVGRNAAGNLAALPFSGPAPHPLIFSFFAAVTTDAYFAVGGFDTELPAHYGSDDILSWRLHRAGYTNAISRAFVAHCGSETFKRAGVDAAADSARCRAYLAENYPTLYADMGIAR